MRTHPSNATFFFFFFPHLPCVSLVSISPSPRARPPRSDEIHSVQLAISPPFDFNLII